MCIVLSSVYAQEFKKHYSIVLDRHKGSRLNSFIKIPIKYLALAHKQNVAIPGWLGRFLGGTFGDPVRPKY